MKNREIFDLVEKLFQLRLEFAKETATKIMDEEPLDYEWMKSFSENKKGLDLLCGNRIIGDSFGIDCSYTLGTLVGGESCSAYDLIKIETNSQDYVICNYLEGLDQPLRALFEWHRVIKSKGVIALSVQNCEMADDTFFKNRRKISCFSPKALYFYMKRAQFNDIKVETHGNLIRGVGVK